MTKPLTAAAVAKSRPGPKRRRIRDSGARSLFLVVESSGHKSWQMRFRRLDGKPAKLTLGPVDMSGREVEADPTIGMPLTLAAARALAATIHRRRALGEDVIGEHKAERQRQRTELQVKNGNTFDAAVRDYFAHYRLPTNGQRPRRWRENARYLGLDYADDASTEGKTIAGGLAEKWADRDVREINDADIWALIADAKERGIPGLEARNKQRSEARARHLFTALSGLFAWLRKERRVASNPCREIDRPAAGSKRDRYLDKNEIRDFCRAAESVGQPFGTVFKLLLLTGGQRLREVSEMPWSELGEDGIWNLPATRTKNRLAHTVPLPAAARDLLAAVPRKKDAELVFTTTGTTPVSGWSRVKRRLDGIMRATASAEGRSFKAFRLHDLRRTAATGMAEIGIAPHIVEAVLNHVSGHMGGVAGIYNRAQYATEKKAALERWAAHVLSIVNGTSDNVVPLHPRGGAA